MFAWLIFAQDFPQGFPSEFGGAEAAPAGLLAVILFAFLIVVLVALAIYVVVCYLVFSCFQRIPPQHRQMEPWQVWLLLIPLFNIVWNFIVCPNLAKSYQSYFAEQGRADVGDCGEKIGLWFAICYAATIIPCVNYVAGPASLVLLIIFLVKVLGLKGQIPEQAM